MKQQTAVEWFFENLNSHNIQMTANELFEKAKEMEKKQIIDAVDHGCNDYGSQKDGEEYYKETYEQ